MRALGRIIPMGEQVSRHGPARQYRASAPRRNSHANVRHCYMEQPARGLTPLPDVVMLFAWRGFHLFKRSQGRTCAAARVPVFVISEGLRETQIKAG